jgi:hypothetical protein
MKRSIVIKRLDYEASAGPRTEDNLRRIARRIFIVSGYLDAI